MTKSEECELPEGHGLCSTPLDCECGCHSIPITMRPLHRCNNPECYELAVEGQCKYYGDNPVCAWSGQTCHYCGIGKFTHSKE